MALEDHIPAEERRLSEVVDKDGTQFCLTDRRVVRYRRSWGSEIVDDLELSHVTSFGRVRKSYRWLALLAVPLGFLMYLLLSVVVVHDPATGKNLVLLTFVTVIALILAGIFAREDYYEFRVTGLPAEELRKWRIQNGKTVDSADFVEQVRERLGEWTGQT